MNLIVHEDVHGGTWWLLSDLPARPRSPVVLFAGPSVESWFLHIDVISEVICRWCFIGKRRLVQAVTAVARRHEVLVRWLLFQLNLSMPEAGISRKEFRTARFGNW